MASAFNCYQSFLYVSKYQKNSKTQLQTEINWLAFTNCAVSLQRNKMHQRAVVEVVVVVNEVNVRPPGAILSRR